MRLFIAAPVDDAIKEGAGALIKNLAASGADCKWVEPSNLHLTLSFRGATGESKVPALEAEMRAAGKGRGPFELSFGRVGHFDWRVIWVEVEEGAPALAELAAALGTPEERKRPYKAHLTLGRVRGPRNLAELKERLKAEPPLNLRCRVNRLVLFESQLSAKGPTYREIFSLPL